jgi:hypothetical protein
MIPRTFSVVVITAALIVMGCGHPLVVRPSVQINLPENDRSILAGEWEYEDGAAVTLRLDEQGNGTYAWKEGRLETTQFGGHTWVGNWYQKENDREGGFVVKLSPDYTEGDGTWWYVRIGSDHAPSEKGGTFHLSKKAPPTNLSDTPPVP